MIFKYVFDNLNNSNYTFDFTYKKEFYIFKIENFLDKETYNYIDKNFPILEREKFKENNSKYSFNSLEENYQKLLEQNPEFSKIHSFLSNQDLSKYFFKKLFFKILRSRMNDLHHFFRMFKIQNFGKPKKTRLFSNLSTRIEYSILGNQSYINPHTDAVKKMLSLMLYFPEGKDEHEFNHQKRHGTEFWSSKEKNFMNVHIKNKNKVKNFRKQNKIIYKTNFEKYHLYGFIRNSKSWHSVEEINENKNFLRKSININIFFD